MNLNWECFVIYFRGFLLEWRHITQNGNMKTFFLDFYLKDFFLVSMVKPF